MIDVLPVGIDFAAFGELPSGVSCDEPAGRAITCTIDASLLEVDDDPVEITIDVTVPATTPGGEVTNQTIVTSPEDEAPCEVGADGITCDPSDTNNYDEVTTPIIQISPDVVTTPPVQVAGVRALAFTGGEVMGMVVAGVGLVLAGGLFMIVAGRRRRQRAV